MNNINDYKRLEFELHEYLVQLKDMLLLLNEPEYFLEKIVKDIEYIKTKKFQVAVIGEFKRGKSSLINALLGADILPSDVTPTTATINRITYGNMSGALINYKDGSLVNVKIDQLVDFVTKLSSTSNEESSKIKEAIITYPVEICRNNIEIIDTPGLNDDERMTEVTLSMLDHIDAAIVTISAVSPVSETEQRLIGQLIKSKNIDTILFVVTFIDQIDEEDHERLYDSIKKRISTDTLKLLENSDEDILKKAHRILDHIKVYGISSKQALKAISMNKQMLMKESGFEEFRTALYQILISEQGVLTIRKSIRAIHSMAEEIDHQFERNKQKCLSHIAKLEEFSKEIQLYQSAIIRDLDIGFAQVDSKISSLIDSCLSMYDKLIQLFIAELSSVRSNSNDTIMNKITKGFSICKEYVDSYGSKNIADQIAEEFIIALSTYIKKQSSLIETADEQDIDMNKVLSELKVNKSNRKDFYYNRPYPEFLIAIPCFSQSILLAEYNVIYDIKSSIKNALSVYKENWFLYLKQLRSWYFAQAEYETKKLCNLITRNISEMKEKNQRILQVNEINYELSKKVSKEIIFKIDNLLNDTF